MTDMCICGHDFREHEDANQDVHECNVDNCNCFQFLSSIEKEVDMTEQREMPKYYCHKQVWALKIKGIRRDLSKDRPLGIIKLFFEGFYEPIIVSHKWVNEHRPEISGYYVVYKDGYTSFSPAKAFEEGYTLVDETPKSIDRPHQQLIDECDPEVIEYIYQLEGNNQSADVVDSFVSLLKKLLQALDAHIAKSKK